MNDSGAGPPELNPVLASCTLKEIEDFFVRCDGTLVTGFGYAQFCYAALTHEVNVNFRCAPDG